MAAVNPIAGALRVFGRLPGALRLGGCASTVCCLLFCATDSFACPSVQGVPDFNCDGKVVISVAGDSVVAGFGDTQNGNQGGYVLRTARAFRSVEFHNLGEPGAHTGPYLRKIQRALSDKSPSSLKASLLESDLVVLDIGRNDRWEFGFPSATYRNILRLVTSIRKGVVKDGETAPLVVVAALMLPNRGSQGPWVRELNALIVNGNRPSTPADLRFDLVSKRLLSSDQIHPTSAGYDALAQVLVKYLKSRVPKLMKRQRPDLDRDGIFDMFEAERFGTDPTNPDSDSDGIKDGIEVFGS